jgi:hypothetical protein
LVTIVRITNRREKPMETSVLLVKGFPVELRKQAKMQALREDTSLKDLIIKAVQEYLKKAR